MGALLGRLGGLMGPLRGILGRLGAVLDRLGAILGHLEAFLGSPEAQEAEFVDFQYVLLGFGAPEGGESFWYGAVARLQRGGSGGGITM